MWRRRVPFVLTCLTLMGAASSCVSEVWAPAVDDEPADLDNDPSTPDPALCAPAATAVPVLPRTSTNEFQRMVSDLLGQPVSAEQFARWTPLAKVWGFDTMTEARIDAQTFEEQWQTTEALAAMLAASPRVTALCPAPVAAPVAPTPACPLHASYNPAAQYSGQQGGDCWSYLDDRGTPLRFVAERNRWEGTALIWDNGQHPGSPIGAMRRWTAPLDGTIVVTGSFADADPGGGDGVIVSIRRQGTDVLRSSIPNASAAVSFDESIRVSRGDVVDFVVQPGGTDAYDTTGLAATIAFTQTPAADERTWASCGQPVLQDIGSRAFRRPLRADELADFETVFAATMAAATTAHLASPVQEGLVAALQAALLSPNVHYKPEFGPGGFDDDEEGFRRAARLALYFRSSFPDDVLWALAAQGGLATDDDVTAQAERLLARDTDQFVEDFAGQWLDFRAPIAAAAESPLQVSMRREAHDVFASVLRDDLPPARLFNPGFTVVDDDLAAYYGFPAVGAGGTTRISTDERGGLLSQGHFLTSTARGTDFKRVIHRGLWTLTRAMCQSVPMLDPATREEINGSVGQIDPATPLPAQMQIHRNSSARCNGCHAQMDPLGLALENYDPDGRFRERYADGSVIDNDFDYQGTSMRNPSELSAYLQQSGDFERCVAEKLLTFGLQRAPMPDEACIVDGIVDGIARADDAVAPSLHQMTIQAFVASLRLTELP